MNSAGELAKLPEYLALEPDLIVEYNVVNDIAWQISRELRLRADRWDRKLARSSFVKAYLPSWIAPTDDEILQMLQGTTLANLRVFHEKTDLAGVELALAGFAYPDEMRLDRETREFLDHNARAFWKMDFLAYAGYRRAVELYNELLREFCREVGIRYIPLAEEYVEHSDRFIDICHVDSDGERLKAEIMAEHLVERIRASFEASTYAPAARPEGQ